MKKKDIINIAISFICMIFGILFENNIINLNDIFGISQRNVDNIILVVFIFAYLVIGGEVVKTAAENIIHGEIFDENFLMTIATFGAFLVGEYPEAVAVMLFYQIGEMFQSYAVNKSRKSIANLMDIKPETGSVKMKDGSIEIKKPEDINVGDILVVKPGEKIALDGVIVSGCGDIDTSALTGESIPRFVEKGNEVISGSINLNSVIEVVVTKIYKDSTVSKILELVENASSRKSSSEKFITKFARYYTPIVVFAAVALAIIPTAIMGFSWENFSIWGYRACSFLVISCPCALVISVPLSFFGGIGGASAKGILVKGSNYLETLSKASYVVCDKTGTLTKGNFKVSKFITNGCDEITLLKTAARAEKNSNHPIALSLLKELKDISREEYELVINETNSCKIQEIAGCGMEYTMDNATILAGNYRLMQLKAIEAQECKEIGTHVYVAKDGKYLGCIVISDEIKEDSKEAIGKLKSMGIKHIAMLTGDKSLIANDVAKKLGITDVFSELLPQDKVEKVSELLKNKEPNTSVVFVGDGINDAPVLAGVDVGIAMGGLGSDAAIEAADVVIMDDNFLGVAKAMGIAKKTVRIVKQNIVFALGVKLCILIFAAFGLANMWMAVFADVGVAFLAILNALLAMRYKERG